MSPAPTMQAQVETYLAMSVYRAVPRRAGETRGPAPQNSRVPGGRAEAVHNPGGIIIGVID
jgi:hypothetical protein